MVVAEIFFEKALRQGDIEQAAERANQSVEDMRSLQFGLELATRYTKPNSRQSQDLEKSRAEMPGMISRGQDIRNQLGELKEKARQQMASVSHTMALEAQATSREAVEVQTRALAEQLLKGSRRALWREAGKAPERDKSAQ